MNRKKAIETVRRLYAEVVRGRTRIRVVEANTTASEYPGRFILSPYRSGTTLLRYCLDSHPDIAVPPETDFLYPITSVFEDRESMIGVRDLGFSEEGFGRELGNAMRMMHDTYAASKSAQVWVDKSPRYASIPNRIMKAFPDSLHVVLSRNPLDQIHSFTRGGSFAHDVLGISDQSTSREVLLEAAYYWTKVMGQLADFAQVNSDIVLTIAYEDLCASPEKILRDVLRHLQLGWSSEVLDYHRYDHDKGREAGRVAGTVGFSISAGGWQEWDRDTLNAVRGIVSSTAHRYGYDVSANTSNEK